MAQPVIEISDIIARARSRADMVDSDFWTNEELSTLAEQKFRRFYLSVVAKRDEFFTTYAVQATVAAQNFTEISIKDLLKPRAIRRQIDGVNLRKIDVLEVPSLVGLNETGLPRYYYWRIDPQNEYPRLCFAPIPNAAYALDFWYVPMLSLKQLNTQLVQKTLYMLAGWDEYLVVQLAIAMKDREESDCSVLLAEASDLYAMIERELAPTDEQEPATAIAHGDRIAYRDPYTWDGEPEPY